MADAQIDFRILGPLQVCARGRALPLPRGRVRALLAALLLKPNEIVPSERLIADLWPTPPPRTVANIVQAYVSRVRKVLAEAGADDLLETTEDGYRLRVKPEQLDAHRFASLVEDGRRTLAAGDAEAARAELDEALSLWRGLALPELTNDSFASGEIARLAELRLVAIEARIDAALALGRDAEVVPELEKLAAEWPLRERFHAQLMTSLYRSGRQAEALEAYRAFRTMLVADFGLEPTDELQALERAIHLRSPSLVPTPRE